MSPLLFKLAQARSPSLILALRPQDTVPDWITDVIYLNPKLQIAAQGKKKSVKKSTNKPRASPSSVEITQTTSSEPADLREPVVEMKNVIVRYGDREILGGWNKDSDTGTGAGLDWTVRKGQRWGVFGPNGIQRQT